MKTGAGVVAFDVRVIVSLTKTVDVMILVAVAGYLVTTPEQFDMAESDD